MSNPVNPDTLAASLERFISREPAIQYDLHDDVRTILAAARAFLEAPSVEWCSVHGSPLTGGVFHEDVRVCQYVWHSGHVVESCIAARVRLVPEEET